MKHYGGIGLLAVVGLIGLRALAGDNSAALDDCYVEKLRQLDGGQTVQQVKDSCQAEVTGSENAQLEELTPLEKRILAERAVQDNPSVITPHKRNYFLPFSYIDEINQAPYADPLYAEQLDNWETKFQLSFKASIWNSIFKKNDSLFFGFTLQSYWQMYNSDISSPFRETNYQPEIFYAIVNDYKVAGWTNRANIIGIEHQSNGQSQFQSRSWNRIYANFIWENKRWIISLKPWYRIPESEKENPTDPNGDDNPDIEKFMGHFELTSAYKWHDHNLSIMLRNNLRSDNRGAVQLDWTFPMGKKFKGYVQYFNGYGENLIDYNHSVERLGIGLLLTDLF